jgi:hypothetical protein
MTGRATEKIKQLTIADEGMEEDESLHVARQPTCEDHYTISETRSVRGVWG